MAKKQAPLLSIGFVKKPNILSPESESTPESEDTPESDTESTPESESTPGSEATPESDNLAAPGNSEGRSTCKPFYFFEYAVLVSSNH